MHGFAPVPRWAKTSKLSWLRAPATNYINGLATTSLSRFAVREAYGKQAR